MIKVTSNYTILSAIRSGITRTNELADKTGFPEDHVCQVCNRLCREKVVHRVTDAEGYVYTPRGVWEKKTLR